MTLAIVFSTFAGDTIAKARAARARIDTALGFPSAGTNAATGDVVPPGSDGWTVTYCDLLRAPDPVNAGEFLFLVGPITQAVANRIAQLPTPPTVVDIPAARWAKGRRFMTRIAGWSNGLPTLAEDQVDFDSTVALP